MKDQLFPWTTIIAIGFVVIGIPLLYYMAYLFGQWRDRKRREKAAANLRQTLDDKLDYRWQVGSDY